MLKISTWSNSYKKQLVLLMFSVHITCSVRKIQSFLGSDKGIEIWLNVRSSYAKDSWDLLKNWFKTSSISPLEANDLSFHFKRPWPSQLLQHFPPVCVLALFDSMFEFPLYSFHFCPVPDSSVLSVEKSYQVTVYPGFVVWVTVDHFCRNSVIHAELHLLGDKCTSSLWLAAADQQVCMMERVGQGFNLICLISDT